MKNSDQNHWEIPLFEVLVNCYRTFKKGAWKGLERVGLDVKKDRG